MFKKLDKIFSFTLPLTNNKKKSNEQKNLECQNVRRFQINLELKPVHNSLNFEFRV